MKSSIPHIVLVGRPNVGKSTLFNRLIRSNRAITHDCPGITRDRMEGIVRKNGRILFAVVDTGGLTLESDSQVATGPAGIQGFEEAIFSQVSEAIESASALCFVVDGQDGLLPLDSSLAMLCRKASCPVVCVVNKVDGIEKLDAMTAEFHSLGFPLLGVSAAHGFHIPELVDHLVSLLGDTTALSDDTATNPLRLALLGRPNAGKSSLINALCGENRMIISDIPGTTRDSVDVRVTIHGEDCIFVDTAGVRRKTKIADTIERYSVNSSLKTSTKADVTLLVLDAQQGLGQQDKRLLDLLNRRKTPFFVLVNKRDCLDDKALTALRKDLSAQLAFCSHVPMLFVSAKTGQGLSKILPMAKKIVAEMQVRIPTGQLNRAMQEVLGKHEPPVVNRARPRFFYLTQAESKPPTFVFFVSDATRVPESYVRYLERGLRKLFGLAHAPMRLHLRSSHGKKEQ
ncbi:MAG: ribosome biogenesis GTPase Der [Desulfovibrio sp.]|nr:ribosome biogenesis GTPase Der [Desulfovibrio sp.]